MTASVEVGSLAPSIRIVFEDDVLMVVDKPQGISVHPAPGAGRDTLVVQIRRIFAARGIPWRHVAAVSRLDRGTSGLVLLVTDPVAHPALHRQVTGRLIRREYQVLVWGKPHFEETVIDLPLGRRWDDHRRMAVYDLPIRKAEAWGARSARTRLKVVDRFRDAALLEATLETGRMHQIRVHCQYIRHPLIGDPIYSGPASLEHFRRIPEPVRQLIHRLEWQCLHAGSIQFQHPLTGQEIQLQAPRPPIFDGLVAALREYNRVKQ